MAQIRDEEIMSVIEMNSNDFWTIAEENTPRFIEFEGGSGLRLSSDNFVSICITQFIELKRGKNFGAVKVHDNKKEEKKENPEEEKQDFKIRDPDAPITEPQRRKIEGETFGFKKAKDILANYLKDNNIDSIDDLTMGHADKVIKAILKAKGGNDQ